MVRATDHVKHVIVDLSDQVKRLQIGQKNVEATVMATKRASVAVKKALKRPTPVLSLWRLN